MRRFLDRLIPSLATALGFRLPSRLQAVSGFLQLLNPVLVDALIDCSHMSLEADDGDNQHNALRFRTTSVDSNGPITIAIRARFEYDSTTIRLQHATRCVRFD